MTAIQIAYKIITEDRDDHWAAQIGELGTTVYGATEEEAIMQVHGMMDFVVSTFKDRYSLDDFLAFLAKHGVEHLVLEDEQSDEPAEPQMRWVREFAFHG